MLNELLTAFALIFVIEGLLYVAAPDFMKKMMREIQVIPSDVLRNMGLFLAVIGVVFVWIVRG